MKVNSAHIIINNCFYIHTFTSSLSYISCHTAETLISWPVLLLVTGKQKGQALNSKAKKK